MSIQINDSDWRPMSAPMTFPALVQWADGKCAVLNANTYTAPGYFSSVLRWQPFKQPELPKKDAFDEWCETKTPGLLDSELVKVYRHEGWNAATAHANKRFSDGVEKILNRSSSLSDYPWSQAIADLRALARVDLRALARGEEADK